MASLPDHDFNFNTIAPSCCSTTCNNNTKRKRKRFDDVPWLNNFPIGLLPEEIRILIVSKLDLVGFHRFSAVCRSWRSIALAAKSLRHQFLLRPQIPWMMLPSSESGDHHHHGFFSLFHEKVFKLQLPEVYCGRCCGSNWGWLIMVGNMGCVFLLNPFTRVRIELPPQATLPAGVGIIFELMKQNPYYIRKAMLLSPPAADDDCLVIVIYASRYLAYCRPGDGAWTISKDHHLGNSFEDIIFYDGKLYAIQLDEYDLILVELELGPHPKVTNCNIPTPEDYIVYTNFESAVYLVECRGELLMVIRYARYYSIDSDAVETDDPGAIKTFFFMIFKLDPQGQCWIKVNYLGDQMLFIGTGASYSLSAPDYPRFRGNCIYFTDDFFHCYPGVIPQTVCHDLGVFHLEDYSVRPFYSNDLHSALSPFYSNDLHSALSPPIWFTPISW